MDDLRRDIHEEADQPEHPYCSRDRVAGLAVQPRASFAMILRSVVAQLFVLAPEDLCDRLGLGAEFAPLAGNQVAVSTRP